MVCNSNVFEGSDNFKFLITFSKFENFAFKLKSSWALLVLLFGLEGHLQQRCLDRREVI